MNNTINGEKDKKKNREEILRKAREVKNIKNLRVNSPRKSIENKIDTNTIGEEILNKTLFKRDKFGIYKYDTKEYYWKEIDSDSVISLCMNYDNFNHTTRGRRKAIADYVLDSMNNEEQITWNKINDTEIICKSYIFDILTCNKKDHDPEFYTDSKSEYDYNPEEICPNWLKCLDTTCESNEEKILSIQMAFGYTLLSHCKLNKAFYIYGQSGSGKSTIFKVLKMLLGKINFSAIPLDAMDDPQALYQLKGKKANILPDITKGSIVADGGWKTIIGGEEIRIKKLYSDEEVYKPSAKHWIGGNHFPEIKDDSDGIYERMIIIPLTRKIRGTNLEDHTLEDKLEKELNGIFAWAIQGAIKLYQNNCKFIVPSESTKYLEKLKITNNPILEFVEYSGLIEFDKDGFITVDKFHDLFNNFHGTKWTKKSISSLIKNYDKVYYDPKDNSCIKWVNGKTERIYKGIKEKIYANSIKEDKKEIEDNIQKECPF